MQSIEKQLKTIRSAALLNDAKTVAWILYSFGLLAVISAISLESIFYFIPQVRYGIWQLSLLITLVILSGFVLIYVLAINNRIHR